MTTRTKYSTFKIDDLFTLEIIDHPHATSLLELIRGNRQHLKKWFPWVDYMQTVNDCNEYINSCKKQLEEGTDYSYVIFMNSKMIGRIGVHFIDLQNKHGAIGYWLGQEYQGQGIITRACKTLLRLGFNKLQLNRIEIKCGVGNDKSAAIPKRLGFCKEGVLRQAELVNDKFIDIELYSLLKQEWKD